MKSLNVSSALEKALSLATEAHGGQVDKGGRPYINHPIAVAAMVDSEDEKVVALLHDVVEDTGITLEDLHRKYGFSSKIVYAVDCITKRAGESLHDYLLRVKRSELATAVKIADLTHNSDLSRISEPQAKDIQRVIRYRKELAFLKDPDSIFNI